MDDAENEEIAIVQYFVDDIEWPHGKLSNMVAIDLRYGSWKVR